MPKKPLTQSPINAISNTYKTCCNCLTSISPKKWMIIGAIVLCTVIVLVVNNVSHKEPTLQERYPHLRGADLKAMEVRERAQKAQEQIKIMSPKDGASIGSPLTIIGQARGQWFSEGIFPVELRDNDGNIISTFNAQAQGDWDTEEFVPFTATVEFASREPGSSVKLVFRNANPSGEPENALEFGMWVTIK